MWMGFDKGVGGVGKTTVGEKTLLSRSYIPTAGYYPTAGCRRAGRQCSLNT